MINWLHISDLHLGSEGAITNMMRDELPEYLKELGVKCDYVFCTGDIRTANVSPNVFTDEMADYLKSICDAVQTSVDRLYKRSNRIMAKQYSRFILIKRTYCVI